MRIVLVKLIDVLARAVFTLGATFMLPLEAAGRFGVLMTLAGLFAFVFGWERHIDLQRRLVGVPAYRFDQGTADAFRLYAFNWIAMLPLLWVSMALWIGADLIMLALVTVITISEQLSNQFYSITVVQPRYFPAFTTVALKNAGMAIVLGIILFIAPSMLSLDLVLRIWAAASVLGSAALVLAWLHVRERASAEQPVHGIGIFAQHRASLTHFLIGLLAVLTLHFDRLLIGGLLPFETVGVYFRHLLLVSIAYQIFNIASYNRVVPKVFLAARTEPISVALGIARRELLLMGGVLALGLATAIALNEASGRYLTERFSLDLALGVLLLGGAFVRVAAELQGMVLNATMREGVILRHQLITFGAGAILITGLTLNYGMFGTAAGTVVAAFIYYCLNWVAVHRLSRNH